jgi:hypothetical protein
MKGISNNSRVLGFVLMATVLWLFPVGNAAAVVTILDQFNSPTDSDPGGLQQVVVSGKVPPGGYGSSVRAASTVVGGFRFIDLGVAGQLPGLMSQALVTVGGVDRYSFSLPDGVNASGAIAWDGANDDPPGACNLNLDLSQYDQFWWGRVTSDHPFTLNMEVWNSTCTASAKVAISIPQQATTDIAVPFSSFTDSAILNGKVGRIKTSWSNSSPVSTSVDLDWSTTSLGVE